MESSKLVENFKIEPLINYFPDIRLINKNAEHIVRWLTFS